MAVGTVLSPYNVENFVHPEKTWYSSKITNSHNQLRHMSSAPQANCVYFVNGKDIYKIDTVTKKRKHVTELPFEPKCTATGHGFFCAGDDKGYFAYLRIPEGATPLTHSSDSPLADLAAASQRLGYSSLLEDPNFLGQVFPTRTRIERIGRDIMNSISVHRIFSPDPTVDDDIVAVITCNDKVLRIWSLTRDQEQQIDEFSQPMNHATVSPDSQRMVVVGDHDYVYFYRRQDIPDNIRRIKSSRDRELFWYKWQSERVLHLPNAPQYDSLAYFTTAWNETGKLCATASESGYITVLNVDALADAEEASDCIMTFVPSSRPQTAAGAVRAMCFAPDPWDYLIWAENNGRVCIGDLRTHLAIRQPVPLDPKEDAINKVSLTDAPSTFSTGLDQPDYDFEMEFIRQRQRELGSDVDSFASMTSALNRRSDFASQRDLGLDEDERQILDNLRTSRERNEAHQAALRDLQGGNDRPTPRSITYLPSARNVDRHESHSRTGSGSGHHTPIPGTGSGSELARLRQDAAVLDTLRNYMRDSNDGHRDGSGSNNSMRRNSVVMSPSRVGQTSSTERRTEGQGDPWRTIEAAITRNRDDGTPTYAHITRNDPIRAHENTAERTSGSHSPHGSNLDLPPLTRSVGRNQDRNSSDGVSINLPSTSGSRRSANATGVTLPSLRSSSLRNSMSELSAALPQSRDNEPSPSNPASHFEPPSMREPTQQSASSARENIQTMRRRLAQEQAREQQRELMQEQEQRERERTWRREALASRQYETNLLRRVGVVPPLRIMNPQEAALHRRVYALPASEAEREEWGIGTAGVMIPPLPEGSQADWQSQMIANGARTVFVGTDEGIMELKLDFSSRKRLPGIDWR